MREVYAQRFQLTSRTIRLPWSAQDDQLARAGRAPLRPEAPDRSGEDRRPIEAEKVCATDACRPWPNTISLKRFRLLRAGSTDSNHRFVPHHGQPGRD